MDEAQLTVDQVRGLRSVTQNYENVENKEKHIGKDSKSSLEIDDNS